VTDENPSSGPESEEAGLSTDTIDAPVERSAPDSVRARPSTPESTNAGSAPGRDRGRTIAAAVLGGLVLLGAVLIARGPQGSAAPPASLPAAALTSAELPARPAPPPVGPLPPSVDTKPRPPPVWRVGSLEREPGIEILRGTLGKHTLAGALAQVGLAKPDVRRITYAATGIRRVEHGGAKDTFAIARDRTKGTVTAFEYVSSPTEVWQAKSDDSGGFPLRKLELFVERKRSQVAVVITADLAKAIAAAGLRTEAIEEIDDALEGHGDAAIIKPGVRLRVVGSEEWVEGTFAEYRVDAIEYVPAGGGSPLRVYYYERDASTEGSRRRTPLPGYYTAKGQQPFRGAFRSPVPLARVTSRFNPKRLHPVLHVVMPHNGIDFGASTGTPVFAASVGTVRSAGNGGPCGNMVEIDHASGLTTAYCHLSRFAAGLRPGQHVEARQLVGYVGATGRVTGPHLHFAVKRGGTFVDPMSLKMDGIRTLPPADRDAFAKRRAELDGLLEAVVLPPADGSAVPDDKDEKEEPDGEE
jgi:murein DD-endopeptidase MepM/ murein hydrolase activator NlpD